MLELTEDELRRYSRHIILPQFGITGQQRLKESRVLVVGAGGLGAPLMLYLAAAGVGCIGVIDPDTVDETNLQRQILYGQSDIGALKTERAAKRLRDINPHIEIIPYSDRFSSQNALQIAQGYNLLADGADNFPTRYLCNDTSVLLGIPNVHGSIFRFEGQVSVFNYHHSACYRCLYPQPPDPDLVPDCAEAGVLGVLPGVVGMLMATEVVKILTGIGDPLANRLLLYDALAMRFREISYTNDPQCPVCGASPTITEPIDYEAFCNPSKQSHKTHSSNMKEISVEELAQLRQDNIPHTLIDVREQFEYDIANIGGTLIPMSQIQARVDEIPHEGRVIVFCRTDGRSARVVNYLISLGYTNIEHLTGGITAWASKIDPSVPKY